ncbi:acetyl-CoA C-acyltransferase [Azospira inquinata]|uniref:acetyl-CoA C-acyltransferase n=1 Tax=Azospira inquinata TaxID=2785627 RepID=A0A975SP63_9RHOO|nr:acetyl-CoA C-acyltransferase [Azospira inquinata]QWT47391.1 acetyl-CoA C-acyltransferase [Azospira inquinata]QWT49986.1 acetyl-CoA C-acyltransferase [Azospira inquinata]
MKQIQDAYIVAATRLPVGKKGGMFRTTRPDDMLAHALQAVLAQVPQLDPALVEDVIVGCAMPEAEQGMNVARIGALLAGLPDTVPGVTINRFCSSGLQAVADAAARIRLGEAEVMLAAGTETMSLMSQMMGNKVSLNPAIFEGNDHLAIAYGMGLTAEKVAQKWGVSREDQDAFALASHQKAAAARGAGHFQAEISPYTVRAHVPDLASGTVRLLEQVCDQDEGPRLDASLEKLAKLKPVFAAGGSVTAGNSSQMSDGAGAVLLVSEAVLKRFNLQPLARFAGFAVAGVPPEVMGIGPIAAIPKVLARAGVAQSDLDWIELNEAFAAQALAVIRELDLDPAKVNPQGGAIALGHPLGATGAIRTATLTHGLRRTGGKWGMVTMCIGTGMGAAGLFQAL